MRGGGGLKKHQSNHKLNDVSENYFIVEEDKEDDKILPIIALDKTCDDLFTFFWPRNENKENPSNSIRKQTWFSWRTNGIQSFMGFFFSRFLLVGLFSFLVQKKKKKKTREKRKLANENFFLENFPKYLQQLNQFQSNMFSFFWTSNEEQRKIVQLN
jgi:hypothetical protein